MKLSMIFAILIILFVMVSPKLRKVHSDQPRLVDFLLDELMIRIM